MQTIRPHWSSRTKLTVVLLLLALGIYLLYRFSEVLPPLILAVIISFILAPIAAWIENHLRLPRWLATLLAFLAMLMLLAAIPVVIIPTLAAQSTGLNLNIQRFLVQFESQLENLLGSQYVIAGWTLDVNTAFNQAVVTIQGFIEPIVGQTLGLAVEAITSLVWVVFVLVISFYLTKDAQALRNWLENIMPPDYRDDFIRLRTEIYLVWSAFFRGQLALATIVSIFFTIIGFIIGMPFALAMGLLAGLLEFLPSVGHAIWLTLATILALFAGSTWMNIPNWVFALIIVGLHLFFQQFDINYLIPRIIGRQVHLPPVVIILGIVTGAVLAGVLGIFLAAPTIASARVIGRYIYANLFDQEPFPDSVAPPLPPPNPRWWRKGEEEENSVSAESED